MALQRSSNPERESWQQRAWSIWLEHRWTLLAALWGAAFILGIVGFGRYAAVRGETRSIMDLVYLSLQLFVLESGSVFGPEVGWDLEAARILAPAVTLVSLYQAISKIVGEHLSRARTWGLKGHIVIAGLGEKGALLARAYRESGQTVLVIERQQDVDAMDRTRDRGILVLVGDATNPAVQRRARVHDAAMLITVGGDESTNAEIARTAREVSTRRSAKTGRLSCVVHILDSHLWNLLRALDLGQHDRFRVEFLNLFQIGALELLADDAVRTVAAPGTPPAAPHIVVVGAGWFGQTLAMRAARLWNDQTKLPHAERMRITLLDRASSPRRDELLFRYPEIETVADVEAIELEVPPSSLEQARLLRAPEQTSGPSAIYVCLDDDTRGLYAGLALRSAFPDPSVPITVRTRRQWGIPRLAGDGVESTTIGREVRIFPLFDRTCRPMLAQRTALNEVLARLAHAEWLRNAERQGRDPARNPNMRPWDDLDAMAQKWNRSQAAHIPVKLELLGCRPVPTPDWAVPPFVIGEGRLEEIARLEDELQRLAGVAGERERIANLKDELEQFANPDNPVEWLAKIEHDRWWEEHREDGWQYGAENNYTLKTNPNMVPWKDLDKGTRDYSRNHVRGIPAFLARAGYQVEKL